MNQCDGCRRGLPKSDNGIHHGPTPWDIICCTADRYAELEREHFGDPDKGTGIYASLPTTSKE
jgi:hypothetical protein